MVIPLFLATAERKTIIAFFTIFALMVGIFETTHVPLHAL